MHVNQFYQYLMLIHITSTEVKKPNYKYLLYFYNEHGLQNITFPNSITAFCVHIDLVLLIFCIKQLLILIQFYTKPLLNIYHYLIVSSFPVFSGLVFKVVNQTLICFWVPFTSPGRADK